MKIKTLLMSLLVALIPLLAFTNETEITTKWVQNKKIMRKIYVEQGKMNELDGYDEKLLREIKNAKITGVEKELADLLKSIITEQNYNSTINIAVAIEILYTKFDSMNYFVEVISSYAGYRNISNNYILIAILNGLVKSMESQPDEVFKILEVIRDYVEVYIVDPQRLNTKQVIAALIQVMREYLRLSEARVIDDKYYNTIGNYMSKMELDSKTSPFDNYSGAKDLRKEHFMFQEDRKKN